MKLSLSSRVHVRICGLCVVVFRPSLASQLERTLANDRAERNLQALRAGSGVFQVLLLLHRHEPLDFVLARITPKII